MSSPDLGLRMFDALPDGRCRVLGVVNVTPDSFSDGGLYLDPDAAVAHGLELAADGADLVEVGGESTRPGAERVDEVTERARVLPVVRRLAGAGLAVSVDTMRAGVAAAALEEGAVLVNDVSGGLADPEMLPLIASTRVPYVLMHWRGHADVMQMHTDYDDVVGEVCDALLERLAAATAAGVDQRLVAFDPGIGFGKTAHQNWQLLAAIDRLVALGQPLLVGASRKAFLGALLADDRGAPAPPDQRDEASAAVSALVAAAGAWCVRVHVAGPSAAAVRVSARINATLGGGARAATAAAVGLGRSEPPERPSAGH
jgi:dihydropteroate synthase